MRWGTCSWCFLQLKPIYLAFKVLLVKMIVLLCCFLMNNGYKCSIRVLPMKFIFTKRQPVAVIGDECGMLAKVEWVFHTRNVQINTTNVSGFGYKFSSLNRSYSNLLMNTINYAMHEWMSGLISKGTLHAVQHSRRIV